MENPENENEWNQGWKPSNRPQSTIAINFMTELDNLFRLDGDLDTLDKTVHEKKQAVSTQTQELEALELRLREAEERLKQAKASSPPRRKDSQRAQDKARMDAPKPTAIPGALPPTPSWNNSADYVLVERPHSSRTLDAETA
ncbi:hypothetical protein ACEQ8H_003146 [Pleosporales sp. CAS-2024a]